MDISVSFCGIKLRNPVIVASSPATENIENIVQVADAGAGAVILKSIADYPASSNSSGARRVLKDSSGIWATSTFERECLSLQKGADLITEVKKRTNIPVIVSVTDSTLDASRWLRTCHEVEGAGCDMIQLDLFYTTQPIVEKFNILLDLLKVISTGTKVPVIAKLNIEIPAYLAATRLSIQHVSGIGLLDSVRVPSPSGYRFISNPGMSSLFGGWQYPLTLHYTLILSKLSNLPICAGGGITTPKDAFHLIELGATCVQIATPILVGGASAVETFVKGIGACLEEKGFSDVASAVGSISRIMRTDIDEGNTHFENAVARVDEAVCNSCMECMNWTFCNAISYAGKVIINEERCEGCGFCASFCKYGAIRTIPL